MTETPVGKPKKNFIRRALTALAFISLIIGGLAAAMAVFLPVVVSSRYCKQWIEDQAGQSLHRKVAVGALAWTWPARLTVRNLDLADEPEKDRRPVLSLNSIEISLHAEKILQRCLGAEIRIHGLDFQFNRGPDGVSNLDRFLKGLTPPEAPKTAEPAPAGPQLPDLHALMLALPVDIWAGIHFTGINMTVEDQVLDQHLAIQDGEFHLDMPDLFSRPIRLHAGADLQRQAGTFPLRFSLSLENRSQAPRTFLVEKAGLEIQARIPGAGLAVSGNGAEGISGALNMELGELHAALESFLPPALARMEPSGKIVLRFQVSTPQKETIAFDCGLTVAGVEAHGDFLPQAVIGPLGLVLNQAGSYYLPDGKLTINQGQIDFLDHTQIPWSGEIRGLGREQTNIRLAADSADLDLGEILVFADKLLPAHWTDRLEKWQQGPMLHIGRVGFTGEIPAGFGGLEISDLSLSVPDLAIRADAGQAGVRIQDSRLAVQALHVVLEDFFPRAVALTTSLAIGDLTFAAEKQVKIKNLVIPSLTIGCDDMRRTEEALFGIATDVTVRQSLDMDSLVIPALLGVEDLKQTLTLGLHLPPQKQAAARIAAFSLAVPVWRTEHPGFSGFETDMDLTLAVEDIRLLQEEDTRLDLSGLSADFRLGELLGLHLTGAARDMGKEALKTEGEIRVDLAEINRLLQDRLPETTSFTGSGICRFQIEGRLPQPGERKPIALRQHFSLKKELAFIDKVEIVLELLNAGAGIGMQDKQPLVIGPITAEPLLQYRYDGRSGKGAAQGRILIQDVRGLPAAMAIAKPAAQIQYNGRHDDLKSLSLDQICTLPSLGLEQRTTFSLYGLNQLLEGGKVITPVLLLKSVGGDFKSSLTSLDLEKLPLPVTGLKLKGAFSMEAGARLIPAKSVAADLLLNHDSIDMEMQGKAGLQRLHGQVKLAKQYRIQTGADLTSADQPADLPPLSALVLEPGPGPGPAGGAENKGEGGSGLLPGPYSAGRNLTFASARIETGGMPLMIRSFQAKLQLNQGLPEIKPFRLDCLGGTLDGTLAVEPRGRHAALVVRLAFSGIDTTRFWESDQEKKAGEDTEINGQLTAAVPVAGDLNMLIDQTEVNAFITHIGARALERFLYALDPHDNNEAVVDLRQRLRTGSPSWIRLTVKDGSLSLNGEMNVQGVVLPIPPIERLNLGALPGMASLAGKSAPLDMVAEIMRIAAAGTILVDEKEAKLTFQ